MANGARFGAKEDYLAYLNRLLDEQREDYKMFVSDITTRALVLKPGFDGHVDLGLELAKLQQVLDTVLSNNKEFRGNDDLAELRQVVENVNQEMEASQTPMMAKPTPKGLRLIFEIIVQSTLQVRPLYFLFSTKCFLVRVVCQRINNDNF